METVLRRFEQPDEVRTFAKGKLELITIGGTTIGRAIYQPGWKWSEHIGRETGTKLCEVEHVGLVLEGHAVVAYEDGTVHDLTAGTVFHVPGVPHDSWVVGNERYVSLQLMGAGQYAG